MCSVLKSMSNLPIFFRAKKHYVQSPENHHILPNFEKVRFRDIPIFFALKNTMYDLPKTTRFSRIFKSQRVDQSPENHYILPNFRN